MEDNEEKINRVSGDNETMKTRDGYMERCYVVDIQWLIYCH